MDLRHFYSSRAPPSPAPNQHSLLDQIEYEEIILRAPIMDSLSQRMMADECTSESEVLLDGHGSMLRHGDHILQINGVPIQSSSQAMHLFRSQSQESSMTLLLARSTVSNEYDEIPDEYTTDDDGQMLQMADQSTSADCTPRLPTKTLQVEEAELDSGISRATDSEPEYFKLTPPTGSGGNSKSNKNAQRYSYDDSVYEACRQRDREVKQFEREHREQQQRPQPQRLLYRSDSDTSLHRELSLLHREMECIRLECDRLVTEHFDNEHTVMQQVNSAKRLLKTIDRLAAQPQQQPAVGISRRNSELTHQASKQQRHSTNHRLPSPYYDVTQPMSDGGSSFVVDLDDLRYPLPGQSMLKRSKAIQQLHASPVAKHAVHQSSTSAYNTDSARSTPFVVGQTTYTNAANLRETIEQQQRALRQHAMTSRKEMQPIDEQLPLTVVNGSPTSEWKVKRRSDGTRYVTRKPLRNQLLKQRAMQVMHERVGVSTDDDAISELKLGRAWTKDDRKRQWTREQAKKAFVERKRQYITQQMQNSPQPHIVKMSQRKMAQTRKNQVMDNFVTVQELLTAAHRDTDSHGRQRQPCAPLLSVTTV